MTPTSAFEHYTRWTGGHIGFDLSRSSEVKSDFPPHLKINLVDFTMSKRNLIADMVLELLDSEHILDTDEESECSEPDDQYDEPDADTAHPLSQYLLTTSDSEYVPLLEYCAGEDSDSESEEEPGDNAQGTIRTSHNGTYWSENPPLQQKTPSPKIMRNPPGPAPGNTTMSPKDAWDLFVTDNMLKQICQCSNLEGQRKAASKKKVWKDISKNELLAFLGISLLVGCEKSWDVSIRELFGDRLSNPMYHATMSIERFEDIRRCLRFDDRGMRDFHLQTDYMAAFRYVWELFLENCRKRFVPRECVTVGEQLLPFRGRCKFKQHMPSKPAKCGIKIFWLCDPKTSYTLDGIAYMGKQSGQEDQKNLGSTIVQKLSGPLRNARCNITMDSFFTSVSLAEAMLEKGLTLVGTLRQNKPDVPSLMKPCKKRQIYSAEFGFKDNITMVSYVPKKGKAVILLSTLHHDKSVMEESRKKKPEIMTYYNSTKGGGKLMDQMVRAYSCKRQTRRWPMVMWYNLLDVATLNAYVLYTAQHPEFMQGLMHKRRLFIKELVLELVKPHMQRRLEDNPRLPKNIVTSMEIFGVAQQQLRKACGREKGPQKKRRCYYCPSNKDRKSSVTCNGCEQHVCKEHSHVVCDKCLR
uniref:piggyBac transposable element-derived protein 4-like n=1 Tax=Myxine glutinosa TaxID=7769 RepID=UPI00358F8AC9